MGIVFLLLLLAQFEPEPRFGVSILQEKQPSAERSRQLSSRDSLNIVLALRGEKNSELVLGGA